MKIMDMKTMETKGRHKMERKRDREKKGRHGRRNELF
jgi:hypothetical protein